MVEVWVKGAREPETVVVSHVAGETPTSWKWTAAVQHMVSHASLPDLATT